MDLLVFSVFIDTGRGFFLYRFSADDTSADKSGDAGSSFRIEGDSGLGLSTILIFGLSPVMDGIDEKFPLSELSSLNENTLSDFDLLLAENCRCDGIGGVCELFIDFSGVLMVGKALIFVAYSENCNRNFDKILHMPVVIEV